jgi:hypothetical protein
MYRSHPALLIPCVGFVLILAACKPTVLKTSSAFPDSGSLENWKISQTIKTYNPDSLFDLVDGQAESFFAYGFEKVSVQRYTNEQGINLNIEIWQLATSEDAFGLFTFGRVGSPITIGSGGDTDLGRRLSFWQNRYFISINADQSVPGETLAEFGQSISGALPAGGERPAVVDRLPPEDLDQQSILFFHEEISVQAQIWLGGENLLGLGQDSDCILGHYKFPSGAEAYLLMVKYPDSKRAAAGLAALQNGSISDVVVASANGTWLAAVIGSVDETQAQTLVDKALK